MDKTLLAEEIRQLTQAMFERDRDHFDLDGKIERAKRGCPVPELAEWLTSILLAVGPEIFEAGFYAGAAAGMEIARNIYQMKVTK